jgi:hypothetical protein
MSDMNLPPDAQADHSGPVADPDSFGGEENPAGSLIGDDAEPGPQPGAVAPPD